MPTSAPVLWVFLHLPKAAGTTINGHLWQHLEWNRAVFHLGQWGYQDRLHHGLPQFEDLTAPELAEVRVLCGHRTYYGIHQRFGGREARYFTVLRDPAERCVSRYNFARSRGLAVASFEQWYGDCFLKQARSSACDFYARRFTGLALAGEQAYRAALALLERCWYVGLADSLDHDLPHLFSSMGLPLAYTRRRVAGASVQLGMQHPRQDEVVDKFQSLTPSIQARVEHDFPWDYRLLTQAKRLQRETAIRLRGT
ncbi:MAG: hypothetical protein AB7S38_35695 [Vulcanimicrobiota bacterium]